jgi:hypothetical protein
MIGEANRYKKRPLIWFLVTVLLSVPLLISDTTYFNSTLDYKLVYTNLTLSIVTLILALMQRKIHIPRKYFLVLVSVFYIYINYYIQVGYFNNLLNLLVLVTIMVPLIWNVVRDESELNKDLFVISVTSGVLIVGLVELAIGLWQIFVFKRKIDINGTLVNSGIYAQYLVVILSMSLAIILSENSLYRRAYWLRRISIMVIVMSIIVIPSTDSRTSWISALLVSSLFIYRKVNLLNIRYGSRRLWLILSTIGLVPVFFFLYFFKEKSSYGRPPL